MVRYWRKVIRIRAEESPNVRLGMAEVRLGKPISDCILTPGVVTYGDYLKRRATWDPMMQCIGLDGVFYQGADIMLYPPEWLALAEQSAERLRGTKRYVEAIGVDSAEGGDNTSLVAIDRYGLIDLISSKTPDTSVIIGQTLAFMHKWWCKAENVLFDAGGGGYEHANQLRRQGYNVRTVRFGEAATPELKPGITHLKDRKQQIDERYVCKNRRAEMYYLLRQRLDPSNGTVFGLPAIILNKTREDGGASLRRQLSVIPLWYDNEGRMYLPPKRLGPEAASNSVKVSLEKLIGCSPDESDALVLAIYGLAKPQKRNRAGVL